MQAVSCAAYRRDAVMGYKLSSMSTCRPRLLFGLLFLPVLFGCKGNETTNKPDLSGATAASVPSVGVPAVVNRGWNSAAGPVMVLPDLKNVGGASVVLPFVTDSTLANAWTLHIDSLFGLRLDLYSRRGKAGEGMLMASVQRPNTENCLHWPQAQLREATVQEWRVGFVRNHTVAIPLDSLEGMSRSDSVLITTKLTLLASRQPESLNPDFQGLPFAIRKAYRFSIGSTTVLIGNIVRRINQEANPREENILLMAEGSGSGDVYRTVFYARAAGSEDIVQTSEVLAAVILMGTGRPFIVLSLDDADGGRSALLERAGNGFWKIAWRSAYTGC